MFSGLFPKGGLIPNNNPLVRLKVRFEKKINIFFCNSEKNVKTFGDFRQFENFYEQKNRMSFNGSYSTVISTGSYAIR